MTKGWASIAIILIAGALIGGGLVLTGGPGQARKERRDQERSDDLNALVRLVDCLANANQGRLPDRLKPDGECNWLTQLNDPFTGAPYEYVVTGPRSYRLCAAFETPPGLTGRLWKRDANGCITRQYDAPQQPGTAATIPYRN